jgi:DNA-binding winged helix-turn-helix (wHTH) protein
MAHSKTGPRQFTLADSGTSELGATSIHFLDSSTGLGRHRSYIPGALPPTVWDETAEPLADADGLSRLVRCLAKTLSAEIQYDDGDLIAKDTDIHSLLSNALEKVIDRIRGLSLRSDDPLQQLLAIVALTPSREPMVSPQARLIETVLRVGSLELDLIDRTAKRGDRPIELKPREFQLLECMMRRRDQLLTRATLFKEVWHYKFVPETNLVDVYMGRLRRKVDGPDETPMIRNVRGAGFVLSATPSHSSRQNAAIRCSG